jgi:aflatoxin B1 aldehyde reductase
VVSAWPDQTIPYEVTLKAVTDLYIEGYFKRFAISNYMAWEVAQICEICKANGYVMPSVYQGVYNALHRSVEPELFPCLRKYDMAFYNYNHLTGSYLTSRYQRDIQDKVS